MADPNVFEASRNYVESIDFKKITEPPLRARVKEEWELFFFADPALARIEGLLRGWMTHAEPRRAELLKTSFPPITGNHDSPPTMVPVESRTKALLWIIYAERMHPEGSLTIARAAFMQLFPAPTARKE